MLAPRLLALLFSVFALSARADDDLRARLECRPSMFGYCATAADRLGKAEERLPQWEILSRTKDGKSHLVVRRNRTRGDAALFTYSFSKDGKLTRTCAGLRVGEVIPPSMLLSWPSGLNVIAADLSSSRLFDPCTGLHHRFSPTTGGLKIERGTSIEYSGDGPPIILPDVADLARAKHAVPSWDVTNIRSTRSAWVSNDGFRWLAAPLDSYDEPLGYLFLEPYATLTFESGGIPFRVFAHETPLLVKLVTNDLSMENWDRIRDQLISQQSREAITFLALPYVMQESSVWELAPERATLRCLVDARKRSSNEQRLSPDVYASREGMLLVSDEELVEVRCR